MPSSGNRGWGDRSARRKHTKSVDNVSLEWDAVDLQEKARKHRRREAVPVLRKADWWNAAARRWERNVTLHRAGQSVRTPESDPRLPLNQKLPAPRAQERS